ncbi:flagellar type III secretion system pore protein FliP [Natronospira bacteriovora]|uniref:Flagellar biosynthetic protein FliP n=1 Tax=Natronospira bacteriovora TaxID=3069753 RepID=A0ABU0W373_9GAMM|nr:flagellar type III secretion system pore protein FliP [Natronospira sp. AB-CW4]MDQ2068464.1 flagellar type III secretion system pore protein FliP [Natronospira sp. AB-CW4]
MSLLILLLLPGLSLAQPGLPAVTVEMGDDGAQTYSVTLQILVLMTALTVLPALLLMMTSFTRIVIVLAILRQAMGTPQTPPNQVLIGLALFLTFFVMAPVLDQAYDDGVRPYLDGEMVAEDAIDNVIQPVRAFMMNQVRENDIAVFARMGGYESFNGPEEVPMAVLVPAFITSELKTAFIIGFLLYIPFVIIDLVVASTLMSMGMLMLSPMLVSLPFKIMLFVLVDGWSLVIGTLASSFFV